MRRLDKDDIWLVIVTLMIFVGFRVIMLQTAFAGYWPYIDDIIHGVTDFSVNTSTSVLDIFRRR